MATRQRTGVTSKPPAPQPLIDGDASNYSSDDVTVVREDLRRLPTYSDRIQQIERRAYELAEQRGFEPGHEVDDWLAAERQIDQQTK